MLLESLRELPPQLLPGWPTQEGPIRLTRCWPVSACHLLLEYQTATGAILAAQWHREPAVLQQLAARGDAARAGSTRGDATRGDATQPRTPSLITTPQGQSLLLHAGGWDPDLPALPRLLRSDRIQLLSHRPGKRAILRWDGATPPLFCKLLSSGRRLRRAARALSLAARQPDSFRTPQLQRLQPRSCSLILTAVEGLSLHQLIREGRAEPEDLRRIGQALQRWHHQAPDPKLPVHRAAEEAAVLERWLSHVDVFLPQSSAGLRAHHAAVAAALGREEEPLVVSHRDLHDKQILISPEQRPGLIDFDTMALAHPALDLANLLAHLELRHLQGRCGLARCRDLGQALLVGHGSERQEAALQRYLDSARLRLACVYAFRPRWQGLLTPLLAQIGRSFGTFP